MTTNGHSLSIFKSIQLLVIIVSIFAFYVALSERKIIRFRGMILLTNGFTKAGYLGSDTPWLLFELVDFRSSSIVKDISVNLVRFNLSVLRLKWLK